MSRELSAFWMLGSDFEAQDTASVVAAARRMFAGECFTLSDLSQVGHPIVYASPGFGELTGYAPEAAQGRNLGFLQRDDSDQEGNEVARAALGERRSCRCVVRNYRRDGSLFFNEQRHVPILTRNGRASHLLVLQRDVSDAVHAAGAEAVGRLLSERAGGRGAQVDYAVLVGDGGDADLAWLSGACKALTGYEEGELLGRGLAALVLEDDRETFEEAVRQLAAGEARTVRYRLRRRDGRIVHVEDSAAPGWRSEEGRLRAAYGVVRDARSERSVEPPQRRALLDALTGLPGLHLLEDRVEQALHRTRREGGAAALVLVDLDDFRFVNETLGADRGDRVLREVATRLQSQLRRSDTLARLDADTFAVLLTQLPRARAALPALEKILAVVAEPFRDGGATMRLSATLGAALLPEGASSAAEPIEHARLALDLAKREDRGSYRFHGRAFDEAMREQAGLERQLRRALLEDQLVLHYQPRVALQTGAVTSVEALVRWAHPERGLLKPAEFLPLAEEARLGGELFEWVLERACRQARSWQQQRTARRVAVNVGPQALAEEGFTRLVQDALTRHDLHPALLELEIDERAGRSALDDAGDRLGALRAMGVHVALDDFGVAYASLAQLRGMPLDGLKIDRSFVGRLGPADGNDVDLVRAIIALGKSLRLTVTAEGIETREQNALLRTLSCDEGQGFLFSQAVPAEYVPAFA